MASARSVHISSKPHDLPCATVSHIRANLHISVASEGCLAASSLPTLTLEDDHELLLVTRAKVDNTVYPSLSAQEWEDELKKHLRSTVDVHQTEQMVFGASPQIHLMQSQEDVNVYAVPSALVPRIDMFFPSLAELDLLPAYSTSFPSSDDSRIAAYLPVQFNNTIDKIASSLSLQNIKDTTRWLSGEDDKSPLRTRHAFTEDARIAGRWLKNEYETHGGVQCREHVFDPASAPNIVCHYPNTGNSSEIVLVGAHYDSRGSFGFVRAPGADDDGSGSAVLLSIAKTLKEQQVEFKRHVMLVAFCSEEQGLRGSRALAKQMKDEGKDVVLMIQIDMIAYREPSEPMQIAFPDVIGSSTARELMGNVSLLYSPELLVGQTGVCCSDHQSFVEQGFTSTWLFERNGPIVTPVYHNSGDLTTVDGYDFEQVYSIGKVILATILLVGGIAQ